MIGEQEGGELCFCRRRRSGGEEGRGEEELEEEEEEGEWKQRGIVQ